MTGQERTPEEELEHWRSVEKRLRNLHYRDGDHCAVCTTDFGRLNAPFPCATIRALENKEPTT
ncbi:hypothetical protein ACF09Y_22435 [Streptomyces massasporeus]|uniref:hypothetical protein n=1 Tax=Streptomyces massasporeus TaxID=67324 RepID=UPI0036F92DF9